MKKLPSSVIILSVCGLCSFVLTVSASDKVSVAVQSVVKELGPQPGRGVTASAHEGSPQKVKVVDGYKAAKDCNVSWYEAATCDGSPVQFKGTGECDKPEKVEQHVSDCGSVKRTTITFASGKKVKISNTSHGKKVEYYKH